MLSLRFVSKAAQVRKFVGERVDMDAVARPPSSESLLSALAPGWALGAAAVYARRLWDCVAAS